MEAGKQIVAGKWWRKDKWRKENELLERKRKVGEANGINERKTCFFRKKLFWEINLLGKPYLVREKLDWGGRRTLEVLRSVWTHFGFAQRLKR